MHNHLDLGVREQFVDYFCYKYLTLHCFKFLMFQLIIPLIHISSDSVYLGNGPFAETDAFLQQLTFYIFTLNDMHFYHYAFVLHYFGFKLPSPLL